jgi:hypothetical protein
MPTHGKTRQRIPIGPADRPAIMKQITSDYLVKLLVDHSPASLNHYHLVLAIQEPLKSLCQLRTCRDEFDDPYCNVGQPVESRRRSTFILAQPALAAAVAMAWRHGKHEL